MESKTILQVSLADLQSCIEATIRKVLHEQHVEKETFLETKDVLKMLNVSKMTLQKWRADGSVPFVKNGGKILYNHEAVVKSMQSRQTLSRA